MVKNFLFPISPLQEDNREEALQKAYPGLSLDEINTFLKEWGTGQEWGPNGETIFTYAPYTYHKNRDRTSQYVNVTHGFRKVPDQGPWPLDKTSFNLFLFGGSTTFGYGVKDDETIAAYLQQIVRQTHKEIKFNIYNFSYAGYYSTQERILFERLLSHGTIPHAAIFLDGLNDFYNRDDVPFFYDDLFRDMFEKPFMARLLKRVNQYYNPIFKIRSHLKNYKASKLPTYSTTYYWDNPKAREKKFDDRPILEKVLKTYVNNVSMAEAAGKSLGVKVGFFWQPIATYKGNKKHFPFYKSLPERNLYNEFGYKLFREKIDSGQVNLPNRFGWLADIQKETEGFLYVDGAHYSTVFSKVLAQHIYNDLVSWQILPKLPK
jgi:hypothetical protein